MKDTDGKSVTLKADSVLKAMVLLGVNAGFGNTEVASLPQKAVDLDGGWIEFPRPKTEIQRRIPLWPETVDVLKAAIAVRPTPRAKADADHDSGQPFKRLGINGRRGLGFCPMMAATASGSFASPPMVWKLCRLPRTSVVAEADGGGR